jgi:hypothetical protein
LDLKWRVAEGGGMWPAIALRLEYQPADGTALLLSGSHAGAVMVATWAAERTELHINAGSYRHYEGPDEAFLAYFGACAATLAITPELGVGAEVVAHGLADHLHSAGGVVGVGWEVRPGRVASAGTGVVKHAEAPTAWVATIGLTASFGGSRP